MKKYTLIIKLYLWSALFCGQMIMRGADCAHLPKEPANLSSLKSEIKRYHDSGAWERATECVMHRAECTLRRYLPVGNKKLAIVFDIDDTVLSSWHYYVKMDFGYDHDRHKDWENLGQSKPIEPVKKLYNFAIKNGFEVFFITGRRENQRAATERNLKTAGFTQWHTIYFKPMNYTGKNTRGFKPLWRAEIVKMGYTIVASFGDQCGDFEGTPRAEHNFKLPNPVYMIP